MTFSRLIFLYILHFLLENFLKAERIIVANSTTQVTSCLECARFNSLLEALDYGFSYEGNITISLFDLNIVIDQNSIDKYLSAKSEKYFVYKAITKEKKRLVELKGELGKDKKSKISFSGDMISFEIESMDFKLENIQITFQNAGETFLRKNFCLFCLKSRKNMTTQLLIKFSTIILTTKFNDFNMNSRLNSYKNNSIFFIVNDCLIALEEVNFQNKGSGPFLFLFNVNGLEQGFVNKISNFSHRISALTLDGSEAIFILKNRFNGSNLIWERSNTLNIYSFEFDFFKANLTLDNSSFSISNKNKISFEENYFLKTNASSLTVRKTSFLGQEESTNRNFRLLVSRESFIHFLLMTIKFFYSKEVL